MATTNTPTSLHKNNVEVRLDHFWSRLNNFDRGEVRGGAIVVSNPRDRHSAGKKEQHTLHFLPKIVPKLVLDATDI